MAPYVANTHPVKLLGPAANRPINPALQDLPFGTTYTAQDTGQVSEVVGVPGTTRSWISSSGSAAVTSFKQDVVAALAAPLPAYTRVGSVLTANANGAFPNVDTVPVTLGQRVLYPTGVGPLEIDNGIYTLTNAGSAGTPWSLTLAEDFASGTHQSGAAVDVDGGPAGTTPVNGGQQFVVVSPPSADVVGTNPILWQQQTGLGYAITRYLDSALGSDTANDGKSPTSAWKSLAPVAALLATVEQTQGRFRIFDVTAGGGTFVMPAVVPATGTFQELIALPPWGLYSEPVMFSGAPGTDMGLGTRTAAGISTTTRAGSTVATVQDAGGAVYTNHAFKGRRLRVTSGTALNKCMLIDDNTTTTITCVGPLAGFANGDTFVVEKPSTVFLSPVGSISTGFTADGPGVGGAIFYGIKFASQVGSADFSWKSGSYLFSFCEEDSTLGGARNRFANADVQMRGDFSGFNNGRGSVNIVPTGIQPLDTNLYDGMFVHNTPTNGNGVDLQTNTTGSLVLVMADASLTIGSGSRISFFAVSEGFPVATNGIPLEIDANAFVSGRWWLYPNVNVNGAMLIDSGAALFFGVQIVSNTYGVLSASALIVDHNGYLRLTGYTAAGGTITTNALNCLHRTSVDVTDANTGSTAAGTAGAVQVGALAAPSTWAQIAGGTAAFCTDLAAASSQICRVGPA